MRPRIPRPAPGTGIGVRKAAREFKVADSVIRYQVRKGLIQQIGGGPMLDAASVWDWYKSYEPHRDNAARRIRTRTIVEDNAPIASGRAAATAGNGHAPIGRTATVAAAPQPAPRTSNASPVLSTREWKDRFYADQCRDYGGDGRHGFPGHACPLNPKTEESYDLVLGRFLRTFATVPFDRQAIVQYIHGLVYEGNSSAKRGQPASGGTKALHHRVLSTFYNWGDREHDWPRVNLTRIRIIRDRPNAKPIWPDETRRTMRACREASEKAIITILAQTAARVSELCSIRKEFLGQGYVWVWGKPTRTNPAGVRPLALPREALELVQRECRFYGSLTIKGMPLAGPVEALRDGVGVDLRNAETIRKTVRVHPAPGAVGRVEYMLRARMQTAQVWEEGKNAHSFRRAYQAEYKQNGGSTEFMRRIMGHFNAASMDDLYTHATLEQLVAEADRYAPRLFLQPEQAAMDLEAALRQAPLEDDDEEDAAEVEQAPRAA